MFDDIEALEKEVESFRKNILASQELVSGIDKMIAAQKEQSTAYSKSYEDVLKKLKDTVEQQNSNAEALLSELSKKNETTINAAVTQLTEAQKEYIARLGEVEKSLKDGEAELTSKYQQFVTKLESTNLDQIYSSVQDLKKSINTKLTLLLSGVGVSVILAIVAIILK